MAGKHGERHSRGKKWGVTNGQNVGVRLACTAQLRLPQLATALPVHALAALLVELTRAARATQLVVQLGVELITTRHLLLSSRWRCARG